GPGPALGTRRPHGPRRTRAGGPSTRRSGRPATQWVRHNGGTSGRRGTARSAYTTRRAARPTRRRRRSGREREGRRATPWTVRRFACRVRDASVKKVESLLRRVRLAHRQPLLGAEAVVGGEQLLAVADVVPRAVEAPTVDRVAPTEPLDEAAGLVGRVS